MAASQESPTVLSSALYLRDPVSSFHSSSRLRYTMRRFRTRRRSVAKRVHHRKDADESFFLGEIGGNKVFVNENEELFAFQNLIDKERVFFVVEEPSGTETRSRITFPTLSLKSSKKTDPSVNKQNEEQIFIVSQSE